VTRAADDLLLGEWACLGMLYAAPSHGFALSVRLRPEGDIGRVWSLSRPLVYRSLEQLKDRDFIREVGEEPGIAGGNRTVLTATRTGRNRVRSWLAQPVPHLRDLRSELLLKLVLGRECGIDPAPLLAAQRDRVIEINRSLEDEVLARSDVVNLWRAEASRAALRFLDDVALALPTGTEG
jgi:PadR family transcriptional regulator AphA